MRNMYLTKDKNVEKGSKLFSDFVFEAATPDELKKALNGGDVPDGYVAGWASTADIDSYGHKIIKGAFSQSIADRGLKGPKSIKLLIGHKWDKLAGEIKVLEYRGSKLWIEAQMALNIGYVNDAYLAAKLLGGTNFSVGFQLQDYSWKETDEGKEFLQIERGDLFEVSIVPFPGNENATMTFIKDQSGDPAPLANGETPAYDDDDSDAAMSSVAEFEKTLVLNNVVKSRNQAREITRLVKANLTLFAPKEAPAAPEEQDQKGPVLDLDKITELTSLVAKMRSVIAPAAE